MPTDILRAYAKINLGLRITERRPDGYHNLQTVFVQVPIYDEIIICESTDESCHLVIEGITITGAVEDNLVMRAWQLAKDYAPDRVRPISVCLRKLVPLGAGMGGGSSDAAAVLRWCNSHFGLGMSYEMMEQMISRIGADCPFFIQGVTTYATGIGDVFSPVEVDLRGYTLVLVKPDIHVSTAEAYAGICPARPEVPVCDVVAQPIGLWRESLHNDFETSVFVVHPELAVIKQRLYDAGAIYASMSGSGSTIFGLFEIAPDAERLRTLFPQNTFYWQDTL